MIKPARSFVLLAATALALTACGSNSSSGNASQKAAESQLGAIESAVAQGAKSSDSATSSDNASSSDGGTTSSDSGATSDSSTSSDPSSSSGSGSSSSSGTDPASVDVCALLTPADGNSVAQANGLGSFTAAKDDYAFDQGGSACKFSFGGAKSVIMEVRAGSFIGEYVLDPKVNGLGDEAYDNGTEPAVRVGDLLITAEMDSLSDAVTLDLLRKMVPHLK